MKTLAVKGLILIGALGAMAPAFAIDPSCSEILSGLSDELRGSIRDLARLRIDLDRRLARGENDGVTRELQSQYLKKEAEILINAKIDRSTLTVKIRVEVELIQENAKLEAARGAQIKKAERQEMLNSETRVRSLGKLSISRTEHAQSALPDGRVIVVGGYDGWEDLGAIELIDPNAGSVEIIAQLKEPRQRHTQSLLADGRILLAGGNRMGDLSSVEVIDLKTKKSTLIGHLIEPKYAHTQSLLLDGRVLIAGGYHKDHLSSIEIIDPHTGETTLIGQLKEARSQHQQSLLQDGRVLVTGGSDRNALLTSIEAIDPVTGKSKIVGHLSEKKERYTQSTLLDGRVIIVGGYGGGQVYLASIEVFDPSTGELKEIGKLKEARYDHTQSILPDGRVLIVGGYGGAIGKNGRVRSKHLTSIEVIDPKTGKSEVIGDLNEARGDHTEAVLPTGHVMVVGGNGEKSRLDSIEIIEPRQK